MTSSSSASSAAAAGSSLFEALVYDRPVAMCTRGRLADVAAGRLPSALLSDTDDDYDAKDRSAAGQPPSSAKKRARAELPASAEGAQTLVSGVVGKENVAKDDQRETKKPSYSLRPRIALAQVSGPNCSGLQVGVMPPIQQAFGSPFLRARAPLDEYETEVYDTMRENERRTMARAGYMDRQRDITDKMRGLLVAWMVEVVQWFNLHDETLFLAVNYVDRFLSVRGIHRTFLQLLGTSALFLASKYEEITPPTCPEFAGMIHETTRCSAVNFMEIKLAVGLRFELCASTPLAFLRHIMSKDDLGRFSRTAQSHAITLCELGLLDYELLQFPPSMVACASWCIARREQGLVQWDERLRMYTHYDIAQLEPCIARMQAHRQTVDKNSPLFKAKHRL